MGRSKLLCYVFGCKSRAECKNDDTTFHRFPKDRALRNVWVAAAGREREALNFNNARICSKHFEEKCFKRTEKLKFLLSGSVPNMFVQTPGPVHVQSVPVPNDAGEQATRTGRPRLVESITVTSGPSLKCQEKISLGPDFNPVITAIKSEADLIKQEVEDPQSDDTLSLAEDADQLSDADQPSEDLIPLSNAQVPLSNAPDPLSHEKVEEVVVGVDEVEVTRPAIKSEADMIKHEDEDPQSGDTLLLAEDAYQLRDADQLNEDLIPLSNAQVPLSNAPDPLSDVKEEEVVVGMDEVEITRPMELTTPVKLTSLVEENRPVEATRPVEETRAVDETRAVEESTVPLPLHYWQDFAPKDCYNLIGIQANQINKLSERCVKQRKKLHCYSEIVRRREKRISNLRAELEALRSFIGECGWEVSSSGGGKIDVRRIQIRSPNTVVGQKKPNRQLLIVKRDYKPPKSSVSAQHTSDIQTSTVGVKRTSDILQESLLDTLHTSDNRRKSSVGVKRTLDIQEKSSVSIPDTSNVVQKSSVGVKRILNNPSIAVPPKSVVPQTSSVGFQRTSDVRQNALVIQIDGMHNAVPRPKLVRLDDNSVETG